MTLPVALRGTLLLVLVFAAGAGTGIVYERRGDSRHHAIPSEAHDVLHGLRTELALTTAQQDAINRILARHQRDVDATWHTMQPRVHDALDAALEDIVGVLTPEQAAQFRKQIGPRHSGSRH